MVLLSQFFLAAFFLQQSHGDASLCGDVECPSQAEDVMSVLQVRTRTGATGCSDCSCCEDGCFDENGQCTQSRPQCFERADSKSVVLCDGTSAVEVQADLGAGDEHVCSECAGGCVLLAGCIPNTGLSQCIFVATVLGDTTHCGHSPQSITVHKLESAGPKAVPLLEVTGSSSSGDDPDHRQRKPCTREHPCLVETDKDFRSDNVSIADVVEFLSLEAPDRSDGHNKPCSRKHPCLAQEASSGDVTCEECQDGCITSDGECLMDQAKCMEKAQDEKPFTICSGTSPVKIAAIFSTPGKETCRQCKGGCLTSADCLRLEGSLVDCMIFSAALGPSTYCGEEPKRIEISLAKDEQSLLAEAPNRGRGQHKPCRPGHPCLVEEIPSRSDDCDECVDGCIDSYGRCTRNQLECLKRAQNERTFEACVGRRAVPLVVRFSDPVEGACDVCPPSGGCSTDGSGCYDADLAQCTLLSAAFGTTTFCRGRAKAIDVYRSYEASLLAEVPRKNTVKGLSHCDAEHPCLTPAKENLPSLAS